jgi:hypothetical protein
MAAPESPRRALFEEAVQAGAPPEVMTRWLSAASAPPHESPLASRGAGALAADVSALEEAPLDARSYLLGQRSALEFAFQEALPQRTALGALQAAVRDLRSAASTEDAAVRGLQAGAAQLEALLVAAEARLAELERRRVSRLEAQLGDCRAALGALRADVARLEASRGGGLLAALAAATTRRGALAAAARLLLCEPPSDGDDKRAERRRALGPLILLLGVEAACRSGRALARPLPTRVRALAAPLAASLALARRAAWAAALVLAFARAKDAAHAASDALLATRASADDDEPEGFEMTPLALTHRGDDDIEEADGASGALRARRAAADSTTPLVASPNYADP